MARNLKLRITNVDMAKAYKAVWRANESARDRMASFVRRRAQTSMRRMRTPSIPGEPPHAHRGWLRRGIFWAHDPNKLNTVIGPTNDGTYKGVDVPRILEHGGTIARMKNKRRRLRRIGDGGEIRLKYANLTFTKSDYGLGPGRHRVGKDAVAYCKLRTAAQVARANRLNAQLYGPAMINATIAARPYMGPAFQKEIDAGTMNVCIREVSVQGG